MSRFLFYFIVISATVAAYMLYMHNLQQQDTPVSSVPAEENFEVRESVGEVSNPGEPVADTMVSAPTRVPVQSPPVQSNAGGGVSVSVTPFPTSHEMPGGIATSQMPQKVPQLVDFTALYSDVQEIKQAVQSLIAKQSKQQTNLYETFFS